MQRKPKELHCVQYGAFFVWGAHERPTVTRSQETEEIAWNTVADTQKGHAN